MVVMVAGLVLSSCVGPSSDTPRFRPVRKRERPVTARKARIKTSLFRLSETASAGFVKAEPMLTLTVSKGSKWRGHTELSDGCAGKKNAACNFIRRLTVEITPPPTGTYPLSLNVKFIRLHARDGKLDITKTVRICGREEQVAIRSDDGDHILILDFTEILRE